MHALFISLNYLSVFVMIAVDREMYRHKDAYYDTTGNKRRK